MAEKITENMAENIAEKMVEEKKNPFFFQICRRKNSKYCVE